MHAINKWEQNTRLNKHPKIATCFYSKVILPLASESQADVCCLSLELSSLFLACKLLQVVTKWFGVEKHLQKSEHNGVLLAYIWALLCLSGWFTLKWTDLLFLIVTWRSLKLFHSSTIYFCYKNYIHYSFKRLGSLRLILYSARMHLIGDIFIMLQKCSIFTTVFNTDNNNVFWAANRHIRMISEGSCDTEDWSNDVENSALPSQK